MSFPRAKVFISCGQATEEERHAATSIALELDRMGFDPYVAFQQQTLKGLKESIFAHLSDSEYFLFVDFRREVVSRTNECRGSLFSHQELAVASYLGLEPMGFQQTGVKLEGVLSFIQGNCQPFTDPGELPSRVRSEITRLGWRPDWKNGIRIERDQGESSDMQVQGDPNILARYFHANVKNTHRVKVAVGCRAYILEARPVDPNRGRMHRGEAVELKWAGYVFPDVIIPPGRSRDLDIGTILHAKPHILLPVSPFADSDHYRTSLEGPGTFIIELAVISENLPESRLSVQVTLGTSIGEVQIQQLPLSP